MASHRSFIFYIVFVMLLVPQLAISAESIKHGAIFFSFDEAKADPSFFQFREQLLEIIRKKDSQALLEFISPNIKNSFGGDDGIKEFRQMRLQGQSGEKFWNEIEQVVINGGCFTKPDHSGVTKEFWAPYLWCNVIRDKTTESGYFSGVVLGKDIPVRIAPNRNSELIRYVSYEEVLVDECTDNEWQYIKLADGARGYIPRRYFRLWVDYRARFIKKDGKWIMDLFLAGD